MNDLEKKNIETDLTLDSFKGLETGFEDTNQDTFKTPFLRILQQLSPELKKTGSDYIENAIEGQFFNTATKELYNEIEVIVLKISHDLVIWKPNRGGFTGAFPKSKENEIVAKRDGVKKYDIHGNDIIDTISFFCINANNPYDIFILPVSSASLKYAKTFSTRIRMLKLNGNPLHVTFAGVWKIKTVEDFNDKGSWYTIGNTPTFQRYITSEELEKCIKPALNIVENSKTDYSQMDNSSDESDNEEIKF